MPSSLTWIDHDPAEAERMQRILALFQVRETRDELGLGAIRDSFADQMFPGTSTIQTRLRYMLFVPWMYRRFEEEHVPSREVASRGRAFELSLVRPLLKHDDPYGVFGRTAGGNLKRLPSSVYWAGLGTWGIRKFGGSQGQYHSSLDEIRRLRERRARTADEEDARNLSTTWHAGLPPEPADYPDRLDFRLRREEAEFLIDRIKNSQTGSLLADLAPAPGEVEVELPWDHPDKGSFDTRHRELLDHAKLFSETMYGAAILYNLMLAEQMPKGEKKDEWLAGRHEDLAGWASSLDASTVRAWRLDQLWQLVGRGGYAITRRTRAFVETWVGLSCERPRKLAEATEARETVRQRERYLKGARSRFDNPSALERWNGLAGMTPLSYRWPTARSYLRDLSEASEGR